MIGYELYNINVTWDLPEFLPVRYNVSLNSNSKGIFISKNVSGVSNALNQLREKELKSNVKFIFLG